MQETELNLKDLFCCVLRKWRKIVIFALICTMLGGLVGAVVRIIFMNDAEKVELWETEFEIEHGMYWAAISDVERKIAENDRLASMAELELANFETRKADFEAQKTDLKSQIDYSNILIQNYEANNEQLLREREQLDYYLAYRKEQNEKSLLMWIDPYNVNVYEVYLRVDSGYEILPEYTYQNIDPTAEILQTYRLLVSKTNFFDQMITDLKLNTEVRYLTEVINVSNYNTNSLCIRVMSDSAAWAKTVAEYVSDSLLAAHGHVEASIAEHKITEYNSIAYSAVDLSVYSKQQSYIQEAIDYEESIRDVNTSILNNEAEIREIHADIRDFTYQIEQLDLAIEHLPLDKQAKEDEIGNYRDANYELRKESIKLREEPEPEYDGDSPISVLIAFIKFALVGGVAGVFIAAVYFVVAAVLSGKILSSEQLCSAMQCDFFGVWPRKHKKFLGSVDRWADRVSGNAAKDTTLEGATNLVLSNASVSCGSMKKILLCGGAAKETVAEIAQAMKAQLPNLEVISGGTVGSDPAVVRGLAECDAVILIEQLDQSDINAAMQLKNRANAMNKPILGAVLY